MIQLPLSNLKSCYREKKRTIQ